MDPMRINDPQSSHGRACQPDARNAAVGVGEFPWIATEARPMIDGSNLGVGLYLSAPPRTKKRSRSET